MVGEHSPPGASRKSAPSCEFEMPRAARARDADAAVHPLLEVGWTATSPPALEPGLGDRLHLLPQLGRVLLRGLHRRRVRPADCGIARRDTKATDLVMTPLRMALWQGGREGYPSPGS